MMFFNDCCIAGYNTIRIIETHSTASGELGVIRPVIVLVIVLFCSFFNWITGKNSSNRWVSGSRRPKIHRLIRRNCHLYCSLYYRVVVFGVPPQGHLLHCKRCCGLEIASTAKRLNEGSKCNSLQNCSQDRRDSEGKAWPSVKRIAADLSISEKTVRRAVQDLEQAGLLRKEYAYRENGSHTSNRYYLL